jgi:integrase/recombinase XerD
MNEQMAVASAEWMVEVGPGDPEWSDHFLTCFEQWLIEGGFSVGSIRQHYLRIAKWLVTLTLPPQPEESPEAIVTRWWSIVESREDISALHKEQCHHALSKVREYLYFQHKLPLPSVDPLALPRRLNRLPAWIGEPLSRFLRLKQRNWPLHSVPTQTRNVYLRLEHLIAFFLQHKSWTKWSQLSLRWVDDYLDFGLRRGLSASTLNGELFAWMNWCHFLQQEGVPVPNVMTQLKPLAQPDRLPRPLTDEQVRRLEGCLQSAVEQAATPYQRQQAIMDRAWFYLLWHCGLRLGEVLRLTLADLDLSGGKLWVRLSKERKDRVVYVSATTQQALQHHLATRPDQKAAAVFTHRHRPLSRDSLYRRLRHYGQQADVPVTAQRLRHTLASQLLNAGMPITSLQRYLGHEKIDTTLLYAQVSDPVLQQDYYRGIVGLDPASTGLLAARREQLQQIMAALRQVEPTSPEHRQLLDHLQQLLDEEASP